VAEDECRVEHVDGVAVSVRGSGPMSPEDLDAFSEVVRAAKQHVAANPPPVSERVKNLADRIERGDIISIARPGIKAAVMEELRRRHPEPTDSTNGPS
jgi:hypothetical protein